MLIKSLLVILFFATLTGCATPYQKVTAFTLSGGYYDQELPTGEFRVGFGGNGYTNATTAMDFAQLRCADLTIEKGKKYFEIVQGGGGMYDDAYWNGYGMSYSSKPSAEYIIRLYDTKPEVAEGKVFNAIETKELIRKRQQVDKPAS
jgi:hypothetical protein